MVLIVPGVCRYAINQTLMGNNVTTIWDTVIDPTGPFAERDDCVQDHAGDIINAWCDNVLNKQVSNLGVISVSWVDMDSLDGTTGARTSTEDHTLPVSGEDTGSPMPGNVAALVTKQINGSRSRRNGRLYVAGVPENDTPDSGAGNSLTGPATAAWQSQFDAMLDDLEEPHEAPTGGYDAVPCVVHVTERDAEGNPTAGVHTAIAALQVNSLLATQRRRLRR